MKNVLLEIIINQKVRRSHKPGKDGVSGELFLQNKSSEMSIISRKIQNKTYSFSPYLEVLLSKGKGKPPRIVSKPTLRDHVVHSWLNEVLKYALRDTVTFVLPNQCVRDVAKEFKKLDEKYSFLKLDIKSFYASIPKGRLFSHLEKFSINEDQLDLVKKSIICQTIPMNESIKNFQYSDLLGVPQGLSISNIVANLYLTEFDKVIADAGVKYFRYVDDILIFVESEKLEEIKKLCTTELAKLGLVFNDKSQDGIITNEFEYLGYKFCFPGTSVRESTVQSFLRKIFKLIAKYKKSKETKIWNNIKIENELELAIIFIRNLNEKITGAVFQNRKYGWVSYFIEIDDIKLLKQIDSIIKQKTVKIFKDNNHLKHIKKITRAYYEHKYSPYKGYILDYNEFETIEGKMKYLVDFGYIRSDNQKAYKPDEINIFYESVKNDHLANLEQDVGFIS